MSIMFIKQRLFLIKPHVRKAEGGPEATIVLIRGVGAKWMSVVSFTPGPLYPHGKSPLYSLNRRLYEDTQPIWMFWSEESFLCPAKSLNPGSWLSSLRFNACSELAFSN
jgi:hypothetical protein